MLVLASISESLVNIASHFVRDAGLPAVFLLMLAESACIPIPSEATMLFAGFAVANPRRAPRSHHLTHRGHRPRRSPWQSGRLMDRLRRGAAGRLELIERHGRWLHLKPSHIAWADRWFERYGAPAVFFSRMLPIIRTFISLPAGVARMPFAALHPVHLAGCLPWVLGLALAGKAVGSELDERPQILRVRRLR